LAEHGLPAELQAFVEQHAGRIVSCKRSDSGASRITWLLGTTRRRCVLRQDPGDGPVAGTPLNLAREASVYRALADTPVKIPSLIASTDDAILMDMATGSPDLGGLEQEDIDAVLGSYIDTLADLHQVPVDDRFQHLGPPASPAEAARSNVKLWADILTSRVKRSSALATFATRWLLSHAPENADRLVVCHGDIGPGNFMHDGEQVTAMLDWEFVHVGDPMDDLAWLAFRGHHFGGGIGNFYHQLERWQQKTGYPVDRRRIAYYRIVVMYIWLVSCLAALDNGAKDLNRFTYLNLITLMNVIMPKAMMEYDGLPLPDVETALVPVDNEVTENIEALTDLVRISWPETDARRGMVDLMGQQVLQLAKLRPDILDHNAAAVAELTGELDHDYEAVLARWITGHKSQETEVLKLLYAYGSRMASHALALAPVIDKPFLSLE